MSNQGDHNKHRERMRAKFIESENLDIFADHEILEILLFNTITRQNTNNLAHRILNEFGSLHNVFDADISEIRKRTGLSEASAFHLSIMSHIVRRYNLSKWKKRIRFKNTRVLGEYVRVLFSAEKVEALYVICLDNRGALIRAVPLRQGIITHVELYPREVASCAISNSASSIVICHNHPSGDVLPSRTDISTTTTLRNLLAGLNITLVDHIIIGHDKYFSFADRDMLHLPGIKRMIEDSASKRLI